MATRQQYEKKKQILAQITSTYINNNHTTAFTIVETIRIMEKKYDCFVVDL